MKPCLIHIINSAPCTVSIYPYKSDSFFRGSRFILVAVAVSTFLNLSPIKNCGYLPLILEISPVE